MDGIDTILLDWDGTIMDTAEVSFSAFQKAQSDLGISITHDYYKQIYAPNWYHMYEALHLPRDKWEEADNLWLRHYGEEVPEFVDHADRVLNELVKRNYQLGVVTSGSRSRVRREIRLLGLGETFGTVVCNEDVANKKPHPEGLEMAMKRMNKRREVCCYVGDSAADVEMGKRADVKTVGIQGHYPGRDKLQESSPDYYFESIVGLLDLF